MKAIIEFDLPEENEEFLTAVHATAFSSTLHEIDNMIRSHLKHGEPLTMESIRDFLWEALAETNWKQ